MILKLDDGSRIGNAETLFRKAGRAPQAGEEGVIHMPLTQCADIGLVSDRDFLRLRRLATTMDILLGLRNETELKGFLPWSLHTEAYDLVSIMEKYRAKVYYLAQYSFFSDLLPCLHLARRLCLLHSCD